MAGETKYGDISPRISAVYAMEASFEKGDSLSGH